MRRLLDVLDGVPLLLGVAPRICQIHLAERARTNFALNDKRLAQLPERLVFHRDLCKHVDIKYQRSNAIWIKTLPVVYPLCSDVSPAIPLMLLLLVTWVSKFDAIVEESDIDVCERSRVCVRVREHDWSLR